MKVKSEREVAQSCPTLSDPMDCSLPGSPAHGIFQARVLGWVAISFSERSPTLMKILTHVPGKKKFFFFFFFFYKEQQRQPLAYTFVCEAMVSSLALPFGEKRAE